MKRLLKLMLFVYYKYTVHMLPRNISKSLDIEIDGIIEGDTAAAECVAAAKIKADIASRQRKRRN